MRDQARKSEQIHINRFLQLVVDIKDLQVSINTDRDWADRDCTIKILHNTGSGKVLAKTLEFFIRLHLLQMIFTVPVSTNLHLKNSNNQHAIIQTAHNLTYPLQRVKDLR